MNTLPVTAPVSNLGQALPHDIGSLHALVRRYESALTERDAAIAQRDARIEHLEAQVRLLLARHFAPSSEKLPDGQLGLFNEAEASAAQEPESAPGTEVAAHRRATPKRAPLPDALARIDIEHPLAHDERTCPHHGVELERFGEVVSEQLDIIPAQVRVLRHVRGKYRCPHCEGHLRTAAMPAQPLPRSLASPGLLAHVATAKYADALPLYRQHQPLKRLGVDLSRTTLATWMVRAGALVVPLINLLREELLDRPYLLMDETTVQVLKEPGKGAQSKSQLWAQMSAGPEPPIVVFDYDPTRAGDVPKRLLAGFTGALHTDGYSGYGPVVREQGLVHLACWAHARRGFTDTLKSLGLNPNKLPPAPPAKARRALSVLHRIRTLYAIERRIRDTPPDQRHRTRQAESVPVLNALRAWLDDTLPKVLPSGPLGKAMRYLDNQWNALVRFCDDGRYGIDTNPVENAIRPFCLGRRNWLFADTVAGANASARLDSLIETAKACPRESGGPTHSNPTPTCATCSPNCPRRNHSPRSKPCCPPGSTPIPSLVTRSKAHLSIRVNSAVPGALTIQLACMFILARPETRSFFACGDFNQRVTSWGTRSMEEMKWAVPDIDTRVISVAYRQSGRLHDLAKRIAALSEISLADVVPSGYVDNEDVAPVLVKNIDELQKIANWLARRIMEIERLVQELPSIAVLVNDEDDVHPIAKALGDALTDQNIRVIPCPDGRVQAKDSAVRVFNVQHIKGLEFEAVFFVGIDRLAESRPEKFDKYLYVGATRAATYLGITCEGELPARMAELEGQFAPDWL